MAGLRDGGYHLYFTAGRDWGEGKSLSRRWFPAKCFEEPLESKTETAWQETQHTSIRVTLHAVPEGNAPTEEVGKRDFPVLN